MAAKALMDDRGDTHYSDDQVDTLLKYTSLDWKTSSEKCACCQRRQCWNQVATLESARQFLVSHVPHASEPEYVRDAWERLVTLLFAVQP